MSFEIDFNILKAITTDTVKGLDFSNNYGNVLFDLAVKEDAKLVTDYIKSYRSLPTKRTLLDKYGTDQDKIEKINNLWEKLKDHEYDVKEFSYDLEQLKERFKRQQLEKIYDNLERKLNNTDEDVLIRELNLSLQEISVIRDGRTHTQKNVADYIDEFEERYKLLQNKEMVRPEIKTGYSMIDTLTGGIAPSELYIIGGDTGAGKSQLLNNLAIQMWMQGNTIHTPPEEFEKGYNVLYFSLEMPYEDCFNRFLARMADVPQDSIKNTCLEPSQMQNMKEALAFIKEYQKAGNFFNIVDVPRGLTAEEMELRYNDALLHFKPDVVVVDYMGLMHDPHHMKDPDWMKLSYIAASLHEFSRAYNVAMVTAVQLTDIKRGRKNKENPEESERVGLHRIGRSSLITHHANVVIQIDKRPNEENLPDLKYHIIKNRKGPLGGGNLFKNFENGSVIDIPYETKKSENIPNISDLIDQIRKNNENI